MQLARSPVVTKPATSCNARPARTAVKVQAVQRPVDLVKSLAENAGKLATVLASTALVAGVRWSACVDR